MNMNLNSLVFGVALSLLGSAAWAQSELMLKGSDINESGLIDALQPKPDPGMGLTRSIRITPVTGQTADASKRSQASLLITFVPNSAELTSKAKDMLNVLGRVMRSDELNKFNFAIEGHADPRGGQALNLQLSQLRAEAVVKYLSAYQNINEHRLTAIGKGHSELMNTRDLGAPENRRITVKTIIE